MTSSFFVRYAGSARVDWSAAFQAAVPPASSRRFRFCRRDAGGTAAGDGGAPLPYISTCAPSSITWFGGRLKNVEALEALRIIDEKRCSRQTAMPWWRVGISVSRPRK